MSRLPFHQVDVFSARAFKGNPLAVVHNADALSTEQMALFAHWTGLSETTFLLRPTTPQADYRVRIFTQTRELPFAGHPTLGSCCAWLANGGVPRGAEVVQECGAGLVPVRRDGSRLAFRAPPLLRADAPDAATLAQLARALRVGSQAIRAAQWIDNGPGWIGVLLGSRAEVLALQPDYDAMRGLVVGAIGPWQAQDGGDAQFEVRAFIPGDGVREDPVTGSLNAGLAQWLIGAGLAPPAYVASQGGAVGRDGRVHVRQADHAVWIGGDSVIRIAGSVTF